MFDTPPCADRRSSSADARFFDYADAADPIGSGLIPAVPMQRFGADRYADGPTRLVELDLSASLGIDGVATGPGMTAGFIRLCAGESLTVEPNATSQVCYVISGAGRVGSAGGELSWSTGALFTLPGGAATLHADPDGDATLYYVHDEPLLRYLGVCAGEPRFEPTLYSADDIDAALQRAAADPLAAQRSRISTLLANARFEQTRTVTHTLWAMVGLLPAGTVQQPHRHQSIALDLIVDCPRGCYSLVGSELNDDGTIRDPQRIDWQSGMAFVTPPGYWHAHVNESTQDARLLPVQDAGLQTYLRSLDIRFGH